MKYNITDMDKELLLQPSIDYRYKLYIIDKEENIIDELSWVQSIGNYSINSESGVRRTASFKLFLDESYKGSSIEYKIYHWIGYDFSIHIGVYSIRENVFKWFRCGLYSITESNTSYSATDNSITVSLSDWYSKLDGTRNGQVGGAPTITIPNTDVNGNPITIKQATEGVLINETEIKKYIVDDIGQFYGMPQNNIDYQQYRKENSLWNQLPYDLEYEAGCTVSSILEEIKNLYPNCQIYFDIYGNFCFNMCPSCEFDPVTLDNDYLQNILLADNTENVSFDISTIKNVTEVFGVDYEIDRYAESCSISTNIYTVTINDFNEYSSGDKIAFIPNVSNIANMKLKINQLPAIPIYYEYTTKYLDPGLLEVNKTYVLQIQKVDGGYIAYYLGKYQPHAICVLTENDKDPKFSKSYFSKKYNCDERNIALRVEKNSPFAVQKIGEILDVKSGDTFENISSDSVALENAIYYNRMSSSNHETVSIITKMIPFLDVNLKIEYKKQQEEYPSQYVIKSIDNNTDSYTSKITMCKFYPLYYKN